MLLATGDACPFCPTFCCKRKNYVNFCRHLDKCKGLKVDSETKLPLLKCSVCKEFECSVNNRTLYVDHIIWCHSDSTTKTLSPPPAIPFSLRVFQCKLCKTQQYMKFEHFLTHFKAHKKRLYKCFKCDYKCSATSRVLKHWKTKHNSDADANDLGEYIKDDTAPVIPWWCPRCPQRFSSVEDRDVHLEKEHENSRETDSSTDSKFDCDTCSKSFLSSDELKLHAETAHLRMVQEKVDDPKDLTCKVSACGEKFTSEYLYEEHRRRVHLFDLIQCEYCGDEFASSKSFKGHLRFKHKNELGEERNFSCELCPKSFKYQSSLNAHKNVVHKREFRHHCHICGKGLAGKMKLITHLARAHQAIPARFPCTWEGCKNAFHEKKRLEEHLSIHLGKPEFKCGTCGKFYYSNIKLNRHTELHVNKNTKPYQCELCPKRYACYNYLKEHKRLTHFKKGKRQTKKNKNLS